ncbi:esterase/lipase family protein [Massilia glaciei]|uniref:Permease n=1 Tax=Massilia glaciei TaxID=1524097 RepID=A0A2U2I781_9BURK|nr:permease [Massilia glaciei]PWF55555.1 permease [Massilia glaciei]
MPKKQSHAADLLGASRLAVEAAAGLTELVEAVHMTVLHKAVGPRLARPVAGVSKLVYRGVKGVTRMVGVSIESVLARLVPLLGEQNGWTGREALLAVLNGVLGDRLAAGANPLAIPMSLRRGGEPLVVERAALAQAIPDASGRILVLAHGLCMNDLQWQRQGHDHGAALALERGYTPVYLHYNSGRHVADNGRELAALLQAMAQQWPVPPQEIVILCHSMGGLLARSACHYGAEAGHAWLAHLSKIVFLGTPHHGAPLERGGNWVHVFTDSTAYSAPFSRLAKLRSAGITDLRHGSVLAADSGDDRFAHAGALPECPPLPPKVRCFTVAATMGKQAGDLHDRLAGDGLVPLASGLGQHADPLRQLRFDAADQAVVYQTGHMALLSSSEVYTLLRGWL